MSGDDGPVISTDAGTEEPVVNLPAPPQVDWIEREGIKVFVDPSVEVADPESKFDSSPNQTAPPDLAYPLDNSMHAPNERNLFVHWEIGLPTQELFAIDIEGSKNAYRFILPCTKDGVENPEKSPLVDSDCVYKIPDQHLLNIGLSNGGESLKLRILGVNDAGIVSTSPDRTIHFAPEVIRGAFYYWSTKDEGIFRAPFGAVSAEEYIAPYSEANSFSCSGCHSVSRDGTTIAFVTGSGFPGGLQVAPTDDPGNPIIESVPHPTETYREGASHVGGEATPSEPHHVQNIALNPDGSWVVAFAGERVKVIDVVTSEVTQVVKYNDPLFTLPEHVAKDPVFSPDGTKVAVALTPTKYQLSHPWAGKIAVMPFDSEKGELGAAEIVVQQNDRSAAFPSWSPDGEWFAFHLMPGDGLDESDDRASLRNQASLYIAPTSGGPYTCPSDNCFHLANAQQIQQGIDYRAGFVRFTPFDMNNGRFLFLTFNADLDYGLLLKNSKKDPGKRGGRVPQMWMAGVDTSKLEPGQDASFAPIWVPLQSVEQTNHFGYWTEKLLCTSSAECGICENCIDEACVPDLSCIK